MEDLSYIDPSSPTLRQSLANVLRGMTKKEDYQQMGQAIQNTAQVMPSVLESLARGGIAQVPGTVGDISQTARDFFPQTMQSTFGNRQAPTTEEILQAVPRINPDYQGSQQHEMVGGLIAPALGKMLKMGAEATKGMKGGLSIEDVSNLNRKQLLEKAFDQSEFTPIYHGTTPRSSRAIEKSGFDINKSADGTIWFTSNPNIGEVAATGSGAVIKKMLNEKNMKLGNRSDIDKYSVDQLIQKGFDGVKLEDSDAIIYQIFHPEKLK